MKPQSSRAHGPPWTSSTSGTGWFGHAVAVGIGARRQRQVAHQIEAVAALDHAVVHLHQRILVQVVAVVEQEDHLPLRRADVAIELHRAVVEDVRDGPLRVVQRAAGDDELAVLELLEELEIGRDRRVENLPLGAGVGERNGLDVLLGRMGEHAADVGPRVIGDQLRFARLQVHRKQAGRVAVAAVFAGRAFGPSCRSRPGRWSWRLPGRTPGSPSTCWCRLRFPGTCSTWPPVGV